MSTLNWTPDKPTVAGWYWHRASPIGVPKAVHITGEENPATLTGQWAGPIVGPPVGD